MIWVVDSERKVEDQCELQTYEDMCWRCHGPGEIWGDLHMNFNNKEKISIKSYQQNMNLAKEMFIYTMLTCHVFS